MKHQRDTEDGVSPVIGTIFLVAITVVLVAIISAVVMGRIGGYVTGLSKLTVYNGANLVNVSTGTPSVGVSITFYNAANLTVGSASVSVVGTCADGDQTIYTGTINIV